LREAFSQIVRQQKRSVSVHVFDLDGFKETIIMVMLLATWC